MKKLTAKLVCLLAALLLLAGCAAPAAQTEQEAAQTEQQNEAPKIEQPQTAPAEEQPAVRTVTDHAGNVVELPEKIERIAVCDFYPLPSVLTVLFDSAEKIVGIPENSMSAAKNSLLGELYPDLLTVETGYIKGADVNIEELIKLKPDVAFYSTLTPKTGELLEKAGIPGIAISASKWDYDAIQTLNNWISLLGQIFPENDRSALVEAKSREIYDLIQSRVQSLFDEQRQKVFFLFRYDDSVIMTSGKHFFGQYWAGAAGAVNAAEELDVDNAAKVSLEQVYGWNPDVIFITNFTAAQPDDIYNNTIGSDDWSGLNAVMNKRVYKMPLGMYRSYTAGIDTPVTLMWFAKTTYPELFEDIDITALTCEYYKEVFGIELTSAQAESIFAPASNATAVFAG